MFVVCRLFMSRSHGEVAARDLPFVSVDAMLPRNAMFVSFFLFRRLSVLCVRYVHDMRIITTIIIDNGRALASHLRSQHTHTETILTSPISHICVDITHLVFSLALATAALLSVQTTTPNSLKCGYRIIRCVCFFSFSVNEHGASECKRNTEMGAMKM